MSLQVRFTLNECYSLIVGLMPIHVSNGLLKWDVYPFTSLSCAFITFPQDILQQELFVSLFSKRMSFLLFSLLIAYAGG